MATAKNPQYFDTLAGFFTSVDVGQSVDKSLMMPRNNKTLPAEFWDNNAKRNPQKNRFEKRLQSGLNWAISKNQGF